MTHVEQFEGVGDGLLVRAPAKVNLSLLIAGKRPDGFHELETVMAKVDWYDEVLIEPGTTEGIELVCTGPHWAPEGPKNLVHLAAKRILAHAGRCANLRLTLTKNIPAGSGLGGASSDAATTLMGIDKYLGLGLSQAELMDLSAELGSDVAFFVNGPLALCTGRGEKIAKLNSDFRFTALLILPGVNVSTPKVYANYVHDADLYERLSREMHAHIEKNRIDLLSRMCANMLAVPCYGVFEELGKLRDVIRSLGVEPLCLSGSGSTLFSILDDVDVGGLDAVRDRIASKTGCRSIVVRSNTW